MSLSNLVRPSQTLLCKKWLETRDCLSLSLSISSQLSTVSHDCPWPLRFVLWCGSRRIKQCHMLHEVTCYIVSCCLTKVFVTSRDSTVCCIWSLMMYLSGSTITPALPTTQKAAQRAGCHTWCHLPRRTWSSPVEPVPKGIWKSQPSAQPMLMWRLSTLLSPLLK